MKLTRQMIECMQMCMVYESDSCVKCEYRDKCKTTYDDCITWLEDKKNPPIEQE